MAHRTLYAYADTTALVQSAAHRLLVLLSDSLALYSCCKNRFDLALTGGSDILAAMSVMSQSYTMLSQIDWNKVHIWWADERFVIANDEQRNAWQARHRLFDELIASGLMPKENLHEMPSASTSLNSHQSHHNLLQLLEESAQTYEQELIDQLGNNPQFDLLILGMGPDAHYASLFPQHQAMLETQRLVTYEAASPKPPAARLTLTTPIMARSKRTWMLTAGVTKRDALERVLEKRNNVRYPASFADGIEECAWYTTAETLPKRVPERLLNRTV